MNYLEVDYKQILFFYAFLRQVDLSLDRSRWTSLKELHDYYQDRISPEQMMSYLKIRLNIPDGNFNDLTAQVENKKDGKSKFKLFAKKAVLSEEELISFHHLLELFDGCLKSGKEQYTIETEGLRVDIAKFYSLLLEPKIAKSDLKKVISIEHYGQNRLLKTKELKDVVPKDFLTT
ncbi:hypothetical protein CEY12_08830 [Chryseobacterium sp. T16E-39]|uniref:hypothetical protein n=1 Tax=Chryseobacterium sp. T16E-39 TaxID=2015076 RepID=UPI000B5B203B|nr:hypothetical protein [Chryseobacterium sp. T16E-39]ASK30208.1 hypothetical protein CEY12_08830 [Chryseobacterium sp. T16E-39]